MADKPLGITEARNKLGTLVARAVHAHQHITISRSDDEIAVLVSKADYDRFQRLAYQDDIRHVKEQMAAVQRGDLTPSSYADVEELHAAIGRGPNGEFL
jgi:prevent-host-death family protein